MAEQDITIHPDQMQEYGENVKAGQVGNHLVIVINLKAPARPSKTGNMNLNASTGGWTSLFGGFRANIMIGKKA